MLDGFRPFGFSDEQWAKAQVLIAGAPEALRQPLYGWLLQRMTRNGFDGDWLEEGYGFLVRAKIGIDLGERAGKDVHKSTLLVLLQKLSDDQILTLTDFVLATTQPQDQEIVPEGLEAILSLAGSKWTPKWDGNEYWRLAERVPEGVETAATDTIAKSADAGKLLQQAWVHAYGLAPDAGAAYRMAVKAVEAAAHQLVEPGNKRATLGTMASVIENQQGWSLPLKERDDHQGDNKALILRMMRMLYEGQQDRHGAGAITLDEARTAIHAAATLTAWFNAGYIAKR